MILFSQYFFENADIEPVTMENTPIYNHDFVMAPSAALGLHNTTKDLPKRSPYGFWVNKWGHWAEVGEMDHAGVARETIERYQNWQQDPSKKFRAVRWVYNTLWNNGWVRVVIDDGSTIYWEHNKKAFTLSQSQQKFFKELEMLYYKPVKRDMDSAVD